MHCIYGLQNAQAEGVDVSGGALDHRKVCHAEDPADPLDGKCGIDTVSKSQ